MIEVVSYPADLATWDPCGPPYLELYGETKPLLCLEHLETTSPHGEPGQGTGSASAIYEYYWTLGISDDKQSQPMRHRFKQDDHAADIWLLFPRSGGWRVCEIVSAIRYLRPLPQTQKLRENVANYWNIASPVIDGMANLIKATSLPLSGIPASLLAMFAKLRITSLPPVEGFAWTIDKITRRVGTEVMDGVHWKLPASIFTELGGTRITGSISVSFHPAHIQQNETVAEDKPHFEQKPILARAQVHAHNGDQFAPDTGEHDHREEHYIKLNIKPCSP